MPKGYKAQFDFSKYKDIEADYLTAAIWCEGEECTDDEKNNLLTVIGGLTLPERRIFLTYAETGTYAETARIFNVNAKTVKNYIVRLKEKIINEFYELNKGEQYGI